jgi:hypothetical protein
VHWKEMACDYTEMPKAVTAEGSEWMMNRKQNGLRLQ